MQKKYISIIKEHAAKNGYKKIQSTIYKIENENVIFIDFLVLNSERLAYRINIKKQSYDKIFWKIMRMEENLNKSDALRVNGAFAAPAILITKGTMQLSCDIDMVVKHFFEKLNEEINAFLQQNDVAQYIFSGNIKVDVEILQCLSYVDLGLLSKAKEVATKQILLGDRGRFENAGKGFFELVVLYND